MRNRFVLLFNGILIFSLIFTLHAGVAFADDGTPTPNEAGTAESTPPPDENARDSEINGTDGFETDRENTPEIGNVGDKLGDGIQPESTPETENFPEQAESEQDTQEFTLAEVLDLAPEGTQFVVLDNEGQVEPLVSQEAAEIVSKGDPMWCPSGALPGDAPCTGSYTSFKDLLANLESSSGDGTIYVAYDYDSTQESDDIIIDGNTYSNLGALTIQGGWDGNPGFINPVGTSSFNGVSLTVKNWKGRVVINDVIFNNTDEGLNISTSGDVSLSNVDVANTVYSDGINIQSGGHVSFSDISSSSNDGSGAAIHAGGDVSVEQSSFNNNAIGLEIRATGEINITNITATGNSEGGASLNSNTDINLTDMDLSNNVGASSGYGLEAISGGNVILENVNANSNYEYGASLSSQGNAEVRNSTFSGNLNAEGLIVDANGQVSMDGVTASNNVYYGASVISQSNVTITNSTFSQNQGSSYSAGLEVTSPGTVILDAVTTNTNDNNGIILYDSLSILLQNVNAQYNGWNGVYIEGDCVPVQAFAGSFSNNGYFGMFVDTGKVYTSGTIFNNNQLGSLSVENEDCYNRSFGPGKGKYHTSFSRNKQPWHILNVADSHIYHLYCEAFAGTILVLDSGDRIKLPCPIEDVATLTRLSRENLPGPLPDGFTYLSGMSIHVIRRGIPLETLDTAMTLSFLRSAQLSNLSILFWNGSTWQELSSIDSSGSFVFNTDQMLFWNGIEWTDNLPADKRLVGQPGSLSKAGFFETVLNFTGDFVLVEK